MTEKPIGVVSHYFNQIHVAGIDLTDELDVGDMIHVQGHTSDFTCKVNSMEVEHAPVEHAHKGESIGVRVPEHAREHDMVYKVAS